METTNKVIHYCWFGNNEMPDLAKKCIDSWYKIMPDFEIKKWDETNFDIENCSIPWVKDTYSAGNFGLCVDYIRLWIMYNYGGIYLDTDVELLKNLDGINPNFFGIERETHQIALGLGFGQEKPKSKIIKKMMDFYTNDNIKFDKNANLNIYSSPIYSTKLFKELGVSIKDYFSNYNIGDTTIYGEQYFCPKNYLNKDIIFSEQTQSIHHYTCLWKDF